MRRVLVAVMVFALSGSLQAGAFTPVLGVSRLQFWQGHSGLLIQQFTMINPDACGRSDQYILKKDHVHFKEVYAMLLAAQTSHVPVKFYIEGCADEFPVVLHAESYTD